MIDYMKLIKKNNEYYLIHKNNIIASSDIELVEILNFSKEKLVKDLKRELLNSEEIIINVEMINEFTNPELYTNVSWGDGKDIPKIIEDRLMLK